MESKSLRPICSIGMFDFSKGVAIFTVVFGHILLSCTSLQRHPIMILPVAWANTLLYSLVPAAGFGFRKLSARKCLMHIKNMFILPYVISALITVFLAAVNDFFLYGSFSSALHQLVTGVLRFLLFSDLPYEIFGLTITDCGPLWFLPAIAGGWFILNLILNLPQGWKCHLAVIFAGVIGYFGNILLDVLDIKVSFFIFHMLIFVPGLYIGYLAKKHRWLEKKLPPFFIVLVCVCLAAFVWKCKTPFSLFSRNSSPLGVFTLFAAAVISFGFLYLMTHINRRENPLINAFEILGRDSIYIYCIHAIDFYGVPWETLRELAPNPSGPHWFFVTLILRFAFIAVGMLVLKAFK